MVFMQLKSIIAVVASLTGWWLSGSENLLPNTDFRLGTDGYSVTRSVDLKYPYLTGRPEVKIIDPDQSVPRLQIRTNGNDMASVFLNCVPLEKNTEYELSFLVQTDTPPVKIQISPYVKVGLNIGSVGKLLREIKDKQPVRMVFPYKTGDDEFNLHGWKIGSAADHSGTAKEFKLSALQLKKSSDPAPVTPKPIEASLSGEKFSLQPGQAMVLKLRCLNRTPEPRTENYQLKIANQLTGDLAAKKTGQVELKPGVTEIAWQLPPLPNGVMQVEGTLGTIPVMSPYKFAVTPRTFVKPGELPIDIGVDSMLRFRRDLWYDDRRQESEELRPHSDINDDAHFLAGTGASTIRYWFDWGLIEPAPGEFKWTTTDRLIEAAVKNNLGPVITLGCEFFVYNNLKQQREHQRLTEWLVKRSLVQDCVMAQFTAQGRKTALPPLELWERMIAEVASRYKGKIESYEIFNEPNLYLKPEETLLYLKSAYLTIKRIDPECKVIGFCVTGDFNAHIVEYAKTLMRLGAGNYCDAISFHPYNNLFEDSPAPGDAMVLELKDEMKRINGTDKAFRNTELYYLNPKSEGGNDGVNGPVYHPGYLIRRYLLDAACGVQQSICVPGYTMYSPSMNEAFLRERPSTFFTHELIPSGNYIASSVFAEQLKNKKFFRRQKIGDKCSVYVYVFQGPNEVCATLFGLNAEMNEFKLIYAVPPAGAVWLNVFGNPLVPVFKNQQWELPIGPIPVYLKLKDVKALNALIQQLTVESADAVKYFGARVMTDSDGKEGVAVFTYNQTAKNQQLAVSSGKGVQLTGAIPAIPGGFNRSFIPATFSAAQAELLVDGKPLAFYRNASARLPLEFRLADGSTGTLRCTGEELQLELTVPATAVTRLAKRPLWEADSVEIFLDGAPHSAANDPNYRSNTYQLIFAPPAPGIAAEFSTKIARLKSAVKWHFTMDDHGYHFSMVLPNKTFQIDPALFGFDIIVNRRQADGKIASAVWSGTRDNYKKRQLFGILTQ